MTRLAHRAAPVVALVLVNVFGTLGQYQWAFQALGHSRLIAAGFAATLESVSLFLTAEASKALLADVRSGTLRIGAYAVGLLVGCLNYVAHAGPHWRPTATGIAFGALSALSPVLWAIHSRSQHRIALQAKGLVDPRAVKFPLLLWALAPVGTFRMFRLAVIGGTNEPATVRAMYAERTALTRLGPADAIRYAFGQLGTADPHTARIWCQARGVYVDQLAIDEVTGGRSLMIDSLPMHASLDSLPMHASPAPAKRPRVQVPTPVPAVVAEPVVKAGEPAVEAAELVKMPTGAESVDHRAQLATCQTKRDAVRYAFSQIGEVKPTEAIRWLAQFDVRVSRSDAYDVAKTATEELPVVSHNGRAPALATQPS
jgi:hypothetical protein